MPKRRDAFDVQAWKAGILALLPDLDGEARYQVGYVLPGLDSAGIPPLLDAARGRRAELEAGDGTAAHDLATRHAGGKVVAALLAAGYGDAVLG